MLMASTDRFLLPANRHACPKTAPTLPAVVNFEAVSQRFLFATNEATIDWWLAIRDASHNLPPFLLTPALVSPNRSVWEFWHRAKLPMFEARVLHQELHGALPVGGGFGLVVGEKNEKSPNPLRPKMVTGNAISARLHQELHGALPPNASASSLSFRPG